MISYVDTNPDTTFTTTASVVRDQLVQFAPSDRQHVTKDDMARLREAGYLPVFAMSTVTLVRESE